MNSHAQRTPAVVNEIFYYIRGAINISTASQIHEAVKNLFNKRAFHDALHLYHDLQGKGLILSVKTPGK